MVIGTQKDAQHHSSSGTCKSKPQEDVTSYLSKRLLSKGQKTTSFGEDVEKREPSCTVGANVDLCNHYGKQYREASKN